MGFPARTLALTALATVACGLAMGVASGVLPALSIDGMRQAHEAAASLVQARPILAAVLFCAACVAVVALSLPGSLLLFPLAGALFDTAWGCVLASFSCAAGSTLAMLASRFLLRDWLRRRLAGPLAAIDRRLERDGALALLSLRLVPVTPAFLLNPLMGLTGMPAWTFHWVNQLGMLPTAIVYANLGTRLSHLRSADDLVQPGFIASMLALAALPLLARVAVRRLASRRSRRTAGR